MKRTPATVNGRFANTVVVDSPSPLRERSLPKTETPVISNPRLEIISAREMDDSLIAQWDQFRSANPTLYSPFFSYEFTEAVQAVRGDCQVAIVEAEQEVVGFLPFHRIRGAAYPVGRLANDAHGFICPYHCQLPLAPLLKSMNASAYHFHAWCSSSSLKETSILGWHPSFLADLSVGPAGYRTWLERRHRTIKRQQQKTRKLIRRHGPLRLEFSNTVPEQFHHTIQLKRQHYQRTNTFDILSVQWLIEVLRYLLESPGKIRGQNSVLWAGDQVIAAHFGLVEDELLHYWFPTYDTRFAEGSPGTELFLQIAEAAPSFGIRRIDFGYGDQPYKHILTNVRSRCPYGTVTQASSQMFPYRLSQTLTRGLKWLPGKEIAKRILRRFHPNWGQQHFC